LARRLEGWLRVRALRPSFETHRFAMLLRMRAAFVSPLFVPRLEDLISTMASLHSKPSPPAAGPARSAAR
jgi:hypothetical protein